MKHVRGWGPGAAILLALVAAGCGGGGGSSGSSNPPPSNVIITISPASQTVGYGSTQQFTAKVTGSTNTAVTWSVSSSGSTSSSQIGSISSSGLYTAPAATSVPAAGSAPQMVTVTGGQAVTSADITVPPLNSIDTVTVTATSQADSSKSSSATVTLSGLSILAVGQCVQGRTPPCIAGATGTEISPGQTITLFVAGFGILPGTTYNISSNGTDVVVTPPLESQFQPATDGTPTVQFQVSVLPGATPGPRNLVVTNQGNELTSFAGAVNITQ